MTRKSKKLLDTSAVKTLIPRDPDTKYMGDEPLFALQPQITDRSATLARAFAWYNRFYSKKEAKDFMCQYLTLNNREAEAKTMRKVDDSEIILTYCWLARMILRGLILTDAENQSFTNELNRLLKTIYKPEIKKISTTGGAKKEKEVVNRPNVQEIMKDKAREAAGELEGIFDEYITSGAATKFSTKTMEHVAKKNVLPQHISILTEVWKKKLREFEDVMDGKDSQLIQAYAHLNKTQVKNIIKFIEQVLSDLNSYISVKKAAKTPRARKAVPVEKLVAKLKYLKSFKDAATKLDLISLHPVKLHGASEAWVYDTAKRKLHHYVADEYSKSFTVKGNTLLGFDTSASEIKTLRKPNEQLKEIMGSKPAARKYFKDIKAVATSPNGRFNDAMIILKAF